jgi:hypothetical protein
MIEYQVNEQGMIVEKIDTDTDIFELIRVLRIKKAQVKAIVKEIKKLEKEKEQ